MFEHVIHLDYSITDELEKLESYDGPSINYSDENVSNSLNIIPAGLIEEEGISFPNPENKKLQGLDILFPQGDSNALAFDIFSAVFFMVSRYEEYNNNQSDEHGRYPLNEQCSFKSGFHKKAIVHHWTEYLLDELQKKFSEIQYQQNTYDFTPTFDIDNAYAFRNKSFIRTIGGLIKNLNDIIYRVNVLSWASDDPYDNYDFIDDQNLKYEKKAIYFLLASNKGEFDRNINPKGKAFKALVRRLKKEGDVGIHPSYASNDQKGKALKEISLLSELAEYQILKSRQHYLILDFPKTYQDLINNGIKEDYTMGFAEGAGFRAGMAVAFPFFDVSKNEETNLLIHPFQFMESSYLYYQSGSKEKAIQEMMEVIDECKKVKGHFIPIWHNESLGEWSYWKGWSSIFESMYKESLN